MFKRCSLLRIARLLLGAFLLSQAVLALAACDWGARDAARAVAMIAAGSEDAPCHESATAGAKSNLCLSHCLAEKQSLDKPSGALSALAPIALVTIVLPVSTLARSHEAWRDLPLAAAAPPPRILFQSFLI